MEKCTKKVNFGNRVKVDWARVERKKEEAIQKWRSEKKCEGDGI